MTMRKLIIIVVFISIYLTSCDPNYDDQFKDDFVNIKGILNDTNRVIKLGDTLKVTLQLPDSMQTALGVVPIHSVQKAFFAMHINNIDTIINKHNLVNETNYWTNVGPSNGFFYFNTTAKPYRCVIYFKPPQKGIYFLEVRPQPGDLKINNIRKPAGLIVDFNVADRHLNLVAPYTPPDGQAWLNGQADRIARGIGSYAFRVN